MNLYSVTLGSRRDLCLAESKPYPQKGIHFRRSERRIPHEKTGIIVPFAGSATPAIGTIDPKAKVDRHSGLRFGFKGAAEGLKVVHDMNAQWARIVLPEEIFEANPEVLEFSWGGKP